jgi:hypothetical protein
MSDDARDVAPEAVDAALSDMKLEDKDGVQDDAQVDSNAKPTIAPVQIEISPESSMEHSNSASPAVQTPKSESNDHQEILGGDIALKVEPGKAPKLSRKSSQKVISRPPPLFDDLPDSTKEAVGSFQVIRDCIYGSKYMGSSEHDALGCDCSEEWGS